MPNYSDHALAVLALLRDRHNVLISGPPGTGKSRLLSEVARAFLAPASSGPVHVPGAAVAIPSTPPIASGVSQVVPSPMRTDRRVFRTVFHQNSKHRDFVTGLVPVVGSSASGSGASFRVVEGTLYRASEHARTSTGASLLVIDEINRGPAVQVFGGSIVAMESDKRLGPDGVGRLETQYFELVSPANGDVVEYALPHHLYLVAAMNHADASVEPLDVAFLRRWSLYRLEPSEAMLRTYFELSADPAAGAVREGPSGTSEVYSTPTSPALVYEAAARAWGAVNSRIRLGRGPEFQIGHGVLMARGKAETTVSKALEDVAESWQSVRAHIDEVFFGDVRGIAAVPNVGNVRGHPYSLTDSTFADEPRLDLVGPASVGAGGIYALLLAVGG